MLTDDMTLRRYLEQRSLLVVGSVGILVRSYHNEIMSHGELSDSIDTLFNESTLHLSSGFRAYVRSLIDNLD